MCIIDLQICPDCRQEPVGSIEECIGYRLDACRNLHRQPGRRTNHRPAVPVTTRYIRLCTLETSGGMPGFSEFEVYNIPKTLAQLQVIRANAVGTSPALVPASFPPVLLGTGRVPCRQGQF